MNLTAPAALRSLLALGFLFAASAAPALSLGQSAANPAYSARQILMADPGAADGIYWIDPDGTGGDAPFRIHADMTTAGGGWTLGLHSLGTDPSATTDMVSNTGSVGLGTGHTRNLTELAISQPAELRHRLVGSGGSVLFDGYYTGTYHGTMANAGGWTVLEGSTIALGVHLGQDWSTAANDVDSWTGGNCAVQYGVPWYYTACWNSIPVSNQTTPATGPQSTFNALESWSIYVRESTTPAAVPEPGTALLMLTGLGGLASRGSRRPARSRRG